MFQSAGAQARLPFSQDPTASISEFVACGQGFELAEERKSPCSSCLVIPLVGHWLRVHQEANFEIRKTAWSWTYTALFNVGILNKIFHCTLAHKLQI